MKKVYTLCEKSIKNDKKEFQMTDIVHFAFLFLCEKSTKKGIGNNKKSRMQKQKTLHIEA